MDHRSTDASSLAHPADWEALVRLHLDTHPALTAQDLCKLVHQGVLGPAHAVPDAAAARERLRHEATHMGDGPPTPIVEPIAPHGAMVRIHLRPFLAAGGSLEALASAFVASAAHGTRDVHALAPAIDAVSTALVRHAPAHVAAWHDELARWRALGTPAVHHSTAYVAAERPAYRVVSGALAASLVP
jgi:hypothetical protein